MAINTVISLDANLSASQIDEMTDWPQLMRNDYLAKSSGYEILIQNDIILNNLIDGNTRNIARANSLIASNASGISKNSSRISKVDDELRRVRALSVSW